MLFRDPFLRAFGVLLVAGALPYVFVPESESGLGEFLAALVAIPISGLVILSLVLEAVRANGPSDRRFWALVAGALVCWFPVHVLALLSVDLQGYRFDLVQDLLFFGMYLCFSLALESRLTARLSDRMQSAFRGVQTVRIAGAVIFLFALFVYFVPIPGLLNREVYGSWVPSFFLYITLDAYLVVRAAGLVNLSEPGPWRATYRLLLATFALWAVSDVTELLYYLDLLDLPVGTALDLLWFAPYPVLLLAIRTPRPASETPREGPEFDSRLARIPVLITQPLFYAVIFPLLHFAAYAADIAEPTLRDARELLTLFVLPVLAGLSFLQFRLLERDNQRLERDKRLVADRAQQSQRVEALGRLAGGIAHDFNNLLQVMRASGELLEHELEPGSQTQECSSQILDAVDRAARLTDQLLTIGRRKRMDPVPLDLNEVVLSTISLVDRVIGADVRVEVGLDPEVGRVRVDRSQLEQALLNLAVNARDAMPGGGTLSFETSPAHGANEAWAMILVRDTGHGMDEETLSRIFEPFFTTKEDGKGTGLGLSTAFGFVTHSGGRIEVESEPSLGTAFRVFLPVYDGPLAASESSLRDVLPEPTRPLASSSGSRRVLVIEDEGEVRRVIRDLLVANGYHVVEARNGDEALRQLDAGLVPDLVLTDVIMPGQRGPELVRNIRRRLPGIKALFMTGHAGDNLDAPLDPDGPMLEKPFTRDSLVRRVREILTSPA